jgi:hypothetical protein
MESPWVVNISTFYRIRQIHHYIFVTSKFFAELSDTSRRLLSKVFTDTYMLEIVHIDTLYEITVINSTAK